LMLGNLGDNEVAELKANTAHTLDKRLDFVNNFFKVTKRETTTPPKAPPPESRLEAVAEATRPVRSASSDAAGKLALPSPPPVIPVLRIDTTSSGGGVSRESSSQSANATPPPPRKTTSSSGSSILARAHDAITRTPPRPDPAKSDPDKTTAAAAASGSDNKRHGSGRFSRKGFVGRAFAHSISVEDHSDDTGGAGRNSVV